MEKAKPKKPSLKNEQPNMDAADRAERMQKLLTGRARSENSVVDYMVNQLRAVLQETEQLSSQLQQTEARATQMRNRLIELRGIRAKYADDIAAFDRPGEASSEKTAEQPPESVEAPDASADKAEAAA